MKYFLFDDNTPLIARKVGYNFPEVYVNGEWKPYHDLACFAQNSKGISEEEAMKAIAEAEKKSAA